MCRREKKNEESGLAAEDGRDHRDRWTYLHESPCVCVMGRGEAAARETCCASLAPLRLMCVCFSGETAFQLRVRTTFSSLKFLMSLEIKTPNTASWSRISGRGGALSHEKCRSWVRSLHQLCTTAHRRGACCVVVAACQSAVGAPGLGLAAVLTRDLWDFLLCSLSRRVSAVAPHLFALISCVWTFSASLLWTKTMFVSPSRPCICLYSFSNDPEMFLSLRRICFLWKLCFFVVRLCPVFYF